MCHFDANPAQLHSASLFHSLCYNHLSLSCFSLSLSLSRFVPMIKYIVRSLHVLYPLLFLSLYVPIFIFSSLCSNSGLTPSFSLSISLLLSFLTYSFSVLFLSPSQNSSLTLPLSLTQKHSLHEKEQSSGHKIRITVRRKLEKSFAERRF